MKATPQPVVSSRYLLRLSAPNIVFSLSPASRATLTNRTPNGTPASNWSSEKTGTLAHSDFTNDLRESILANERDWSCSSESNVERPIEALARFRPSCLDREYSLIVIPAHVSGERPSQRLLGSLAY